MELYAFHNYEALYGLFNAIAAIMGGANYAGAIAVCALLGFVTVLVGQLLRPGHPAAAGWLIAAALVYGLVFVPKVSVTLVDRLGVQPNVVIGNVPIGLAFFGSLTSSLGEKLTRYYETALAGLPGAFGIDPDFAYQDNGLLFGTKLIARSQTLAITDPVLLTDLTNFITHCTVYDLSDGRIAPDALQNTPNLWQVMAATNPARFTMVGEPPALSGCDGAHALLTLGLSAELPVLRNHLARELYPQLPPALAQTRIDNALLAAYAKAQIGGAALSVAEIIRQNALINAFRDAGKSLGARIRSPEQTIMGMATAQGTAAMNAQYAVQLSLAEEALPMVRNVLQGALYMCFPLVLLLAFAMDAGRMLGVLASYLLALVWIELWPPLYAVLNHYGTLRSLSVLNAAAWTQSAGGASGAELTLGTARGIYEAGISEMAVIGYLVLAVPMFASALVFGVNKLGSIGVASLVGAGAHRAGDTALGNVSSGMVNMDKADLAHAVTDPAMLRTATALGTRVGQLAGAGAGSMLAQVEAGRGAESIAFEQQQSRLSSSFTVSGEQVEQYSRQADRATSLSRSMQEGASRAQSAALVNAFSLANEATRAGSVQGEAGQATLGGTRNAFTQLQELADGVQRTLGKENGARVMNQALAGGGLNLNVLRAGIEGSNSSHEAMAAANQLVDRFQRSSQGVQSTELMRQWRESSSYQWARSHNQRGVEAIESNWREGEELNQRAERTLQHAEVYRRAAENAQRLVQQGRTDLTTGIAQFAYATERGAMVETLDPIAQRRNLNALRLEYLGRGGFLADGAFVPSIDALGAGTGRSAREQLGATEARLGTEASATASFDSVRSETIADPLARRSRSER